MSANEAAEAPAADTTGAPVIPIGLWGTEHVWPRRARLPRIPVGPRPRVTATVGPPVELPHLDLDDDTERIMAALMDLLPPEAREEKVPTEEELALTYPPGYSGDPEAERDRRPGATGGYGRRRAPRRGSDPPCLQLVQC